MHPNTKPYVRRACLALDCDVSKSIKEKIFEAACRGFDLADKKDPTWIVRVEVIKLINRDFFPLEEFFSRRDATEIQFDKNEQELEDSGLIVTERVFANWFFLRFVWLSLIQFDRQYRNTNGTLAVLHPTAA